MYTVRKKTSDACLDCCTTRRYYRFAIGDTRLDTTLLKVPRGLRNDVGYFLGGGDSVPLLGTASFPLMRSHCSSKEKN